MYTVSSSTGRDMSLYSPTEVTFREELRKLREKFPDHILILIFSIPGVSKKVSVFDLK